jgi:signal transduction histidine kinase/ActR/RegA family two-component response regulator
MHTLLVIASQSSFIASIEAALDPGVYRVIAKEEPASAASLLGRGAVDAIILDLENSNGVATRAIVEIRSLDPDCPLIVFGGFGSGGWEEEAYLLGTAHVLEKPVRARLLQYLLSRTLSGTQKFSDAPAPPPPLAGVPYDTARRRGLDELRHFSSLLVHSLNVRALIRDGVQQLREALGVNRVAVFLRKASALPTDGAPSADDQWLRPAHTIGHDPALIEHFPLSLSTGLGQHLTKYGRILRADSAEVRGSREMSREFHTLGSAIALPINDREALVGALLLDERITGGTFSDEELAQLFHWLEELGVAIRNCWRHEQLAATHGLIDDILAGVGNGCIVVGSNCGILHANPAALRLLVPERTTTRQMDFAEIPQQIGSLIFQVIQSGTAATPFKWVPPARSDISCRVTIHPFTVGASHRPNAALLVLDDITEHERASRLELEAGKLRLVRQMSWHLAHEIGNAVTPVSTMQQILDIQGEDADVRKELSGVLAGSVKRITRLTQQMTFLSRDWDGKSGDSVKLTELIEGAYQDASNYQPVKKKTALNMDKARAPWKISGDTKALRHAFSELLINALQANPDNPTITIRMAETPGAGGPGVAVEFQDTGAGFSREIAEKIGEPFQSTRSVGLGLGLSVSRKIIESHRGSIEIPNPDKSPGIIRVTLPLPEAGSN